MKYQLPKEFSEKWVAALRSGEYKQGRSYLAATYTNGITSHDKYCCLGVACSVGGMPFSMIKSEEFIKSSFAVPNKLIGNRSQNELVKELTTMNDGNAHSTSCDKSFSEIADWIEQNVEFI